MLHASLQQAHKQKYLLRNAHQKEYEHDLKKECWLVIYSTTWWASLPSAVADDSIDLTDSPYLTTSSSSSSVFPSYISVVHHFGEMFTYVTIS